MSQETREITLSDAKWFVVEYAMKHYGVKNESEALAFIVDRWLRRQKEQEDKLAA